MNGRNSFLSSLGLWPGVQIRRATYRAYIHLCVSHPSHPYQVSAAIREVVPSLDKDEFTDVAVSYVAAMCGTLMNLKHTSEEQWEEIPQYLSLIATKAPPSGAAESLRKKCADMMVADEVEDDDEDAEELCNCQFTLAYGEMTKPERNLNHVRTRILHCSICHNSRQMQDDRFSIGRCEPRVDRSLRCHGSRILL